jgi:hypothetical protein
MKEIKNFIFCQNRKCSKTECLRHNVNTPFGIIITRATFSNKKGRCEGYVTEQDGVSEWIMQE